MGTKQDFVNFLKELENDWMELTYEGEGFDGYETVKTIEGDNLRWTRPVEVITRDPEGNFWKWSYEEGLTENQEHIGPCYYGEPEVVQVEPVEKTIVVTEWVTKK